ncbi:hypothetical protein N7533_000642 [Penicillium manginii]|jgi:phosphatidylserine decarboxylase|uniref:uncharacterized protein n=1 Tax=Penicillium manginii TaxID=203109 RepID=UPI002546F6B8|nr:uncharacterized protein N7533_000642 [Penicillium manginii]KAJ5768059.1 hypothetical protein N7533_000642 [Penicillium manginii]
MDDAQGFLTHINTRGIVIIEADNPALGLVAFVAVGMHEASSCVIDPAIASGEKAHVKKGEEIGMFHYGGSSYCIIFQRKARLKWIDAAVAHNGQLKNLALNSALAYVWS